MGLRGRNPVVRALVVLGMTILVLLLSAILLPPQGSDAMPRDGGGGEPAIFATLSRAGWGSEVSKAFKVNEG